MIKIFTYISLFTVAHSFGQTEHAFPIISNDIVYDAVTNKIYASIPSANGENGNSIGVINLSTYMFENTIHIGGEPNLMAISDNGKYIYAGLDGSSSIVKFNVATQTVDLEFPVGVDQYGTVLHTTDIEVMPGNDSVIAISRGANGFSSVAIFDNDICRPTIMQETLGGGKRANRIEFEDNTTLFGYNNQTTGFDFSRLIINAAGVTRASGKEGIPGGYFNLDFIYHNHRAYFTNGSVIDLIGNPVVIGRFPNVYAPMAYDSLNNYVCYAQSTNDYYIDIKMFNPVSFVLEDQLMVTKAYGKVKKIITCGEGCYAINTTDNNIVVIKNSVTNIKDNILPLISLSPNPSTDYIKIDSADTLAINNAKIYSLNGSIVSVQIVSDNTLNIRDLAQGVYIVQLTDENDNTYTKKVVKI